MRRSEISTDFAQFWAQERECVYRSVTLALGDPSLAAEAVDEAMTRALERWPKVSRYERPAGWVYRVAINWATSHRRKLASRPTRLRESLDQPVTDYLPDVDLTRQLAALKHVQRSVVLLRFYLQMTTAEIAEVLDLPVGTVKSHLHRGLARLRAVSQEASL